MLLVGYFIRTILLIMGGIETLKNLLRRLICDPFKIPKLSNLYNTH